MPDVQTLTPATADSQTISSATIVTYYALLPGPTTYPGSTSYPGETGARLTSATTDTQTLTAA